jgi:hypothetical protein
MNPRHRSGGDLLGGGAPRIVANRDVRAKPTWMCSRRSWERLPPAEAPFTTAVTSS